MAYSSKVGSFNLDTAKTAGQTQAITGVGFQPKIVLFWWCGSTGTSDATAGGNINVGFGAATGSSERYCVAAISLDAAAASDGIKIQYNDACIAVWADNTSAIDGFMDFASLDADGFTLTVDNQFTIATRISYLALGGTDLTNVKVGQVANIPASTGNYSTTGTGFQPDAVILEFASLAVFGSGSANLGLSLGLATSSSAQGFVAGVSQDNQATMNTNGYGYDGEAIGGCNSTGTSMYTRSSFVSMDADGFTLNCLEVGTAGRYGFYIALKGGQYKVGSLTTRTDGNDIAVTGLGFTPVGIMFLSANRALSTQDEQTAHARMSIGAGTSTSNRAAQAFSDEDNLADSETAYANYDSAVYVNVVDDAAAGLMDIKSIDSGGFTCVMDDTDPAGCFVTYLAIGATATTTTRPDERPFGINRGQGKRVTRTL
jgi:hypothetical protein